MGSACTRDFSTSDSTRSPTCRRGIWSSATTAVIDASVLPRQRRGAPPGEDLEALIEPAGELVDRQKLQPGHGQLDRERNAVEPAADRSDRRRIGVGERESDSKAARANSCTAGYSRAARCCRIGTT